MIVYREGTRKKAEERPNEHADSRWLCPHCGAGVFRKQSGEVGSHRIGGGRVMTRSNDIPCIGTGQRPKVRPGLKVRKPNVVG